MVRGGYTGGSKYVPWSGGVIGGFLNTYHGPGGVIGGFLNTYHGLRGLYGGF